MHDEAGFLSAIRQTPADDTARLVFADWLDEQDDPACKAKAEFIRLELRMAEAPLPDLAESASLRSLAVSIPNEWLAVVSHVKLEGCRQPAAVPCPHRWELLAPTSLDDMRRCEQCMRATVFCPSIEDAREQIPRGTCVVVSPAVERRPGDLYRVFPSPPRLLGSLRVPPRPGAPSLRLTPEMVERLRVASAPGTRLSIPQLLPPPPPPPVVQEWLPAAPAHVQNRLRQKLRRKKDRGRNRNLQRENWEDAE